MNYKLSDIHLIQIDGEGQRKSKTGDPLIINLINSPGLALEATFQNKQQQKTAWTAKVRFRCYQIAKSEKSLQFTHDYTQEIAIDQNSFRVLDEVTKDEKEWLEGKYEWEIIINGKRVKSQSFILVKQEEAELPCEIVKKGLYEGPQMDFFSLNPEFKDTFLVEETRYIRVFCQLKNLKARAWVGAFKFRFCSEDGNQKYEEIIRKDIKVGENEFTLQSAWGNMESGTLEPGKFKVYIIVGEEELGVIPFTCTSLKESDALGIDFMEIPKPIEPVEPVKIYNLDRLEEFPPEIDDQLAVQAAYRAELEKIADYLQNGLSVLIECDKILVELIYEYVCKKAGKMMIMDHSYDIKTIYSKVEKFLKGEDNIMVFRSVELLGQIPMGTFALYHTIQGHHAQFLGFKDPSESIRKVISNRFSVHISLAGLHRHIQVGKKEPGTPGTDIMKLLVTKDEIACFQHPEPGEKDKANEVDTSEQLADALFKQVSSLNIIQFRNAMRYIGAKYREPTPAKDIFKDLRWFKVNMLGDDIEIPDTTFDDIGGYNEVKRKLFEFLKAFSTGKQKIRSKGFIFHGPPGTGKTLFAKAIANEMNATIQMISGPEIIDKWVGQSEQNVRQIFATARRNAPSVILFDEFDSIASKRSQGTDGGARVNNSVMAQLLTELDGFHQDGGVMVIGTTNRLDIIDPALRRPSRLAAIEIGLPDYDARVIVAGIHGAKTGVEAWSKRMFEAAYKHIDAWAASSKGAADIPKAFWAELDSLKSQVQEIDKKSPKQNAFQRQWEKEDEDLQFQKEVVTFFNFLTTLRAEKGLEEEELAVDGVLGTLEHEVKKMAKKYNLTLKAGMQLKDKSFYQQEVHSLFALIHQIKTDKGVPSADSYWNSIITLVAEFSKGFNNDHIRMIFEEAANDFEYRGRIITPRYFGQKIGLIKKTLEAQES